MADSISGENQFWIQILGDYARLIRNSLYPTAGIEVERADSFIAQIDELLQRSRQKMAGEQMKLFNQQVFGGVQDFRKFILHILKHQISEKNMIVMNSSTLNEYVTDTERYMDILDTYMKSASIINPVADNITWLLKIYMGATHLQDSIGIDFIEYKRKASVFANAALDLYLRSYVTIGLRRTNLRSYPALEQLMADIQNEMTRYAEYLVDLILLIKEKRLLGSITLLDLDNQYRQTCYYLTKLAMFSEIRPPVCDPATPRDSE